MGEFPQMPQEPIDDKKEKAEKEQKKPAKVETPAYFVPTKKEVEEKKSRLKEKFDYWREQL